MVRAQAPLIIRTHKPMNVPIPEIVAQAHIDAFGKRVTVGVSTCDAFLAPVDVLALKYAQAAYGADKEALRRLGKFTQDADLPEAGGVLSIATTGDIAAPLIVLVGTVPLRYFEYAEIREFARRAVASARGDGATATHLGMTMHGVNTGLDEAEAFTAQLAGLLDALRRREWPEELTTVTIFERDEKRARRIGPILERVLPREIGEQTARASAKPGGSEEIESAGLGSRSKPHVFVAMQFGTDTDDIYHYGIQSAVRSSGLLCERIDAVAFTGDILTQIKSRIDSAALVVADLSAANPNVYLEVGYAWGRGIPTVLLARNANELRFDVQSQRCVLYSSIRDLEAKLTAELRHILSRNPVSRSITIPTVG